MKKAVTISLLTLLFAVKTFACLNGEQYSLKNNNWLFMDHDSDVPEAHNFTSKQQLRYEVIELDSLYKKTNDIDYLSDKGLVLVVLGNFKEAIEIYKFIESISPNRYSTASNIGTAYELIGDNVKALQWIEKAIRLNKISHHGSEWIHANILKAKISADDDNISSDFLLNANFGDGYLPTSSLDKESLLELSLMLFYQLSERMSFVKPNDKIVAQLLFDYGNIMFLRTNYRAALETYKKAKEYGFSDQLIDYRIKSCTDYSKGIPKSYPSTNNNSYYVVGVLTLIAIIIIAIVVKRRRSLETSEA